MDVTAKPDPEEGPGPATTSEPEYARCQDKAIHLRETSGALFLYGSMFKTLRQPDAQAFRLLRDDLLAAAGDPSDPLEVMMLEQVALAHFNVGRLQLASAWAENLEGAKAYGYLAIGLSAEFRKGILALAEYRLKGQQAAANRASRAPSAGEASTAPSRGAGTELEHETMEDQHDGTDVIPLPATAANSDGTAGRRTKKAYARGSGAAACRGAG